MKTPFVHNQLVNSIITSQRSERTGNRCATRLDNLQRTLFMDFDIINFFWDPIRRKNSKNKELSTEVLKNAGDPIRKVVIHRVENLAKCRKNERRIGQERMFADVSRTKFIYF